MNRKFTLVFRWLVVLFVLAACAAPAPSPTPAPTTAPSFPTTPKTFAGASMEPSFHDGQIVEVEVVHVAKLRRGDVVLFALDEERQYLKRLIGLPDETVEIRDGKAFIDGKPLEEPYVQRPATMDVPAITLKSGEYYVLGDNRPNSSDSRQFGPISGASILGRVKR
jgi:signal peptidase I